MSRGGTPASNFFIVAERAQAKAVGFIRILQICLKEVAASGAGLNGGSTMGLSHGGDEIPAEIYKAVAEVLVFVLRLSGRA